MSDAPPPPGDAELLSKTLGTPPTDMSQNAPPQRADQGHRGHCLPIHCPAGPHAAGGPSESTRASSEAAPKAVRQAVGGGCQSGWGAVTVGYKCR